MTFMTLASLRGVRLIPDMSTFTHVHTVVGHVKRLLQGIGELTELIKSGPAFPSLAAVPGGVEPPVPSVTTASAAHSNYPAAALEDTILPPPQSWISSSPDKVDFGRMKDLIETRIGDSRMLPDYSEEQQTRADANPPPVHVPVTFEKPPQLPPKKKYSPSHEAFGRRAGRATAVIPNCMLK